MAYVQNESLIGTRDGVNKTFTTAVNTIEIDNIFLKNTRTTDFEFTAPNTVVLASAPEAIDVLTASYWTVGSLINSGAPYEIPSTLESLTYRVRSLIGEQYSEEWVDRAITDWLNEAINKICMKTDFPFMEGEATIFTVANQEAYQLPAGFKKIIKVLSGSSELPYSRNKDNVGSGYALLNNSIIIPKPTTGAELKIRYWRYLPYFDWTDTTTTSKLPRQYESLLVDYAVSRAKQAEEIYDVAKIHEEKFLQGLDAMILDLSRRVDAEYPSIMPVQQLC